MISLSDNVNVIAENSDLYGMVWYGNFLFDIMK